MSSDIKMLLSLQYFFFFIHYSLFYILTQTGLQHVEVFYLHIYRPGFTRLDCSCISDIHVLSMISLVYARKLSLAKIMAFLITMIVMLL